MVRKLVRHLLLENQRDSISSGRRSDLLHIIIRQLPVIYQSQVIYSHLRHKLQKMQHAVHTYMSLCHIQHDSGTLRLRRTIYRHLRNDPTHAVRVLDRSDILRQRPTDMQHGIEKTSRRRCLYQRLLSHYPYSIRVFGDRGICLQQHICI